MDNFTYRFRILSYRIIDGDSIVADLDLGLGITTTENIRLADIDAPEIRTKDLYEKEAGIKAKNWLIDNMDNAEQLVLETLQFNRGRYGRLIGYVIADGVNLNTRMLSEGLAVPYL